MMTIAAAIPDVGGEGWTYFALAWTYFDCAGNEKPKSRTCAQRDSQPLLQMRLQET